MTCRWPAGLVFWLAIGTLPALAQTPDQPGATSPAATTPAPAAAPKVLDVTAEPAADRKARFQFVRVGDSILKLDGDGGEVSLCSASGGAWVCQALPQNRVALEQDIGRLRREIGELTSALTAQRARSQAEVQDLKSAFAAQTIEWQRQIADLKDDMKAVKLAAMPPPPPPAPPERPGMELRMPSAGDYERARTMVEDAWRRLVAGVAQVQSDVMRKF